MGERGETGEPGDKGEPWSPENLSNVLRETLLFLSNTTDIKGILARLMLEEFVRNADVCSELGSIMNITSVGVVYSKQNTTFKDRFNNNFSNIGKFVDAYWYYIIIFIGAFAGLIVQRKRRGDSKEVKNEDKNRENAIEVNDEDFHQQLNFLSFLGKRE